MAGKICVTGATGYVARHIVSQALDAGYAVMGTARTAEKVYQLENDISHPKFRAHNAELTASWGWQAAMARAASGPFGSSRPASLPCRPSAQADSAAARPAIRRQHSP